MTLEQFEAAASADFPNLNITVIVPFEQKAKEYRKRFGKLPHIQRTDNGDILLYSAGNAQMSQDLTALYQFLLKEQHTNVH